MQCNLIVIWCNVRHGTILHDMACYVWYVVHSICIDMYRPYRDGHVDLYTSYTLGFSTSLQGLLGCGGFGTVELWEHKGGEFWTPWGPHLFMKRKRETMGDPFWQTKCNLNIYIYLNNLNTTLLGVLPPQIVRVSPHPGLTLGCVPKILYLLTERYNVWIPVTWAPGNGDTYALKGLSKAASWVNQGMAEADETPKQILQNRSTQMTEIWKQMKAQRWLICFWFRVLWVWIFEPYHFLYGCGSWGSHGWLFPSQQRRIQDAQDAQVITDRKLSAEVPNPCVRWLDKIPMAVEICRITMNWSFGIDTSCVVRAISWRLACKTALWTRRTSSWWRTPRSSPNFGTARGCTTGTSNNWLCLKIEYI